MKKIKVDNVSKIPKNYTGIVEDKDGDRAWYLNGKKHRTDGPAIERKNGYRAWYLNDELHRTDGPAIEYVNGDRAWFLKGNMVSEEKILKSDDVRRIL